jgi:AcrR family transcriptional regulator
VGRKKDIRETRLAKKARLLLAMEELSAEHGLEETAVDEITRRAGVAKGTFYNYFKDKADIVADLVTRRSRAILRRSLEATRALTLASPVEELLSFVDHVIEILRRDRLDLELLHKNLTWDLCHRLIAEIEADETLREISERFRVALEARDGGPGRDLDKILYMLLQLISAVCYSAIVRKEPASMGMMKPVLMDTVRRIVT